MGQKPRKRYEKSLLHKAGKEILRKCRKLRLYQPYNKYYSKELIFYQVKVLSSLFYFQ